MTDTPREQMLENLESDVNVAFVNRQEFVEGLQSPYTDEQKEELDRLNRLTLEALNNYYVVRDRR